MSKSDAIDDVSEEWIREFVISRISDTIDNPYPEYISDDGLRYEIIFKRKKDMKDTNNVIEKMKNLGLDLCRVPYPNPNDLSDFRASDMDHVGDYDLQKFSILRGWL